VRFAYEAFEKLKPGVHIMELHGRQKQNKRTAIYYNFVEEKYAFLFATDIASRGMDFPLVDWVVQLDCPEDA
jgi:ATP-dependent RNA helicase DDX10/DBP4